MAEFTLYQRNCSANMRECLVSHQTCLYAADAAAPRSAARKENTRWADRFLALAIGWASR